MICLETKTSSTSTLKTVEVGEKMEIVGILFPYAMLSEDGSTVSTFGRNWFKKSFWENAWRDP